MSIPRSTQAGRGELVGPAPTRGQVQTVLVQIEYRAPGMLVLTQPDTGLVASARNQPELAAVVSELFVSAQVQAYSRWRQGPVRRFRPAITPRRGRRDVYPPEAWRLHPDLPGMWVSPRGHVYAESTQSVQRVMAARVAKGLPARPPLTSEAASGA